MYGKIAFHSALAIDYVVDQFGWHLVKLLEVILKEAVGAVHRIGFAHFDEERRDYLVTLLDGEIVKIYGFHL